MSGVSEPPHLLRDLRELRLPSVVAQWERLAEQARRKRFSTYFGCIVAVDP